MKTIRAAVAWLLVLPYLAFAAGTPQGVKASRTQPDLERPLKWLVAAQNENGGFGAEVKTKPDVATTAITGLALIRLGHTMTAGQYQEATRKAAEFVARAAETTPITEVAINPAGTQPQAKLGRNVDTFLAAQFLAEALKSMPKGKERERIADALDSCVERIQASQRKDGSFSADGWAPILSSAFASGGLYAAQAAGARVRAEVLAKGDKFLLERYDPETREFKTGESAGIGLYAATSAIKAAERAGKLAGEAAQAAMHRLSDENFLRGAGTYGGEEHVSYMLTSEAFASMGGEKWERWNRGIQMRLANIQRADGTWRGDHCITSTTFCTAASLLTLTIQSTGKKVEAPKQG